MHKYFYQSVCLSVCTCSSQYVSISVYLSVHADVFFYYFVCLSIMSIDGHVCFYPSVCLYMHMYGSISQCHEICFTKLHSKAISEDPNDLVHQSSLARPFSVHPNVILFSVCQILFKYTNVCMSIVLCEIGSGHVVMVLIA